MRDLWRRTRQDQDGAAIVLLSFMLLFLLGISAFAVDLGWLWVNGSRVQRAADSAALAGVTNLPADSTGAFLQASNASRANGFEHGANANVAPAIVGDNQLQVTVSAQIPTFFLRVFGQNPVTITKQATAEYVLPVRLGSPFSHFGDNSAGLNFWASINGEFTHYEHGDPFATRCDESADEGGTPPDAGCNSPNPQGYRANGYYIGIEVPAGATALNVEIFDAAFYDRGTSSGQPVEFVVSGGENGPDTTYRLYDADTTPYDLTDLGAPRCTMTAPAESPNSSFNRNWASVCGGPINVSSLPGIYVLQVTSSGGGTLNSYGVRTQTAGGTSKVFGLNDISIFADTAGGVADLYLAEVLPVHANKTFLVSLFDTGDTTGSAWVEVLPPSGVVGATCTWQVRGGGASGAGCRVQTSDGSLPFPQNRLYNAQWIDFTIDLPDSSNYNCDPTTTTGCWWRMALDYPGTPTDRTTWEASVIGNPVRLVPNP